MIAEKIAIVTGGNGGLGSVIVKRFLSEGCIVYATVRSATEKIVSDSSRRLHHVTTNVTKEEEVRLLIEKVRKEQKGIDILVNTVGGFLPRKPVHEISFEEWQRMMDVNLTSTFLCTREAVRQMRNRSYGRIVNFSAMVGLQPSAGRSAYAISKAGVAILTEVVAKELTGIGITINAIAPSIVDTKANRESMPDEDFSAWVKPEAIADTIVYLCSDSAADISGSIIKAYGGV
jgi:NAD(P)-dependent dehydrogenase (short-subunit alcohol dehydrogenase family)